MHTQNKPNNITSNLARWHQEDSQCTMDPPKISLFNRKRLLQILATNFTQEQEQMEKESRVGEEERFGHSNSTMRIDVSNEEGWALFYTWEPRETPLG
jgi:hypothetical protein